MVIGASGIGFAVAEGALAEGASVVVGSSQAAKVEAAVKRLGDGASGGAVNANDEASIAAFLDTAGAFDHLIFTAGDWGSARFVGSLKTWTSRRRPARWACASGAR